MEHEFGWRARFGCAIPRPISNNGGHIMGRGRDMRLEGIGSLLSPVQGPVSAAPARCCSRPKARSSHLSIAILRMHETMKAIRDAKGKRAADRSISAMSVTAISPKPRSRTIVSRHGRLDALMTAAGWCCRRPGGDDRSRRLGCGVPHPCRRHLVLVARRVPQMQRGTAGARSSRSPRNSRSPVADNRAYIAAKARSSV